MSERAKVPSEELQPALEELQAAEWVQTESYFVWIRNHLRYDPMYAPNNPKHVAGLLTKIAGLPKISLTERFVTYYQRLKFIPKGYRIGNRVGINPLPLPLPKPLPIPAETDRESDSVQVIFAHWQQQLGKPDSVLTPKRRALILARLREGYSVADILRAIDGNKSSKFHQGENDRKTVYNDLTLICRSGEKLEWFRDMTKAEAPISAPKFSVMPWDAAAQKAKQGN